MDKDDLIWIGGALIWLAIGLTLAFFSGATLRVACTRVEPTQVDCVLQTQWLAALPVDAPRTIAHVQKAVSTTTCGHDDCTTTLQLVGRNGTLDSPSFVLTDTMGKEAQSQLQAFIESQAPELILVLVGWGGVLIGLPVATAFFILPATWALYRRASDPVRDFIRRVFPRPGKRPKQRRSA